MRRILTLASCFVLALGMTSAVKADVFTAEQFWQKVQAQGVSVGDTIRVVFITSATIDGEGVTQGAYEPFATDQAATGSITNGFGFADAVWNPIVSTLGDVGASPSPVVSLLNSSDAKVFNSFGELVADSGSVMLGADPAMQAGIRYDQSANDKASSGSVAVWTGTNASGNPATIGSGAPLYLGGDNGAVDYAAIGDGGQNGTSDPNDDAWNDWLYAGNRARTTLELGTANEPLIERSIYVMSGEITVVPEPSTILMWLGFTGVAGLVYWRKRRS